MICHSSVAMPQERADGEHDDADQEELLAAKHPAQKRRDGQHDAVRDQVAG
jgi:hypothetical protein